MPASVPSETPLTVMREAAPIRPPLVHAQEHLAPVLGVDPTVLGVDLHDGIGLVVRSGEQATQVELVETPADVGDRRLDVGFLGLVALLAGQLMQHFGVGQGLLEPVVGGHVVAEVGVLGVQRLGVVGIVPQVGAGHLRLDLGHARAGVGDVEVPRRLVEPPALLAEVVGEVPHGCR